MPIENRNLEPGTKLVGRYKGQTYQAEVVQTEEGIRYRLEDGRYFCNACMAAFEVADDQEPAQCPQGHGPDGSPVEKAAHAE